MQTILRLAILCLCILCNTLCAQQDSTSRRQVNAVSPNAPATGEHLRSLINTKLAEGDLAREKGQVNIAIFNYRQARKLAKNRYPQLQLTSHERVAELHLIHGDYEAAYQELGRAYDILEKVPTSTAKSSKIYLQRLRGALFGEVGLDTLAIAVLDTAFRNAQNKGDTVQLIEVTLTQADFWEERDNLQAAQKAYEQGLQYATALEDAELIASSLLGIGVVKYKQKETNTAYSYFQKALQQATSFELPHIVAHASAHLGMIALDKNQLNDALKLCDQAYEIAVNRSLPQIQLEACDCLGEAHERQGNWETALILLRDYNRLEKDANEELVFRAVSASRFQQQLQELTQKQAAERNRLISEQERTQEDLLNERRYNRLLIYFLFTALVFAASVYWFYRRNKQRNLELKRLNKQLSLANETLAENNQALGRFAAVAAHDLKGPLRSIQSFSALLAKLLGDRVKKAEQECLQFINSSSSQLTTLIDDLLSFSRLGKQMEPAQPVDLQETISVVAANLHEDIQQKKAVIDFKTLPSVLAKDSLMVLLFQNLISNSLKFIQADTIPQILIRSENLNNGHTRITVQDNGIGIPESEQEKVFELFTRLHPTRVYEGSGVGLATCRKIVQHYAGTIGIISQEGKGTTVWVELPTAENTVVN